MDETRACSWHDEHIFTGQKRRGEEASRRKRNGTEASRMNTLQGSVRNLEGHEK